MQRFVRLNEVQYADTEEQANVLVEQGFTPAPIEDGQPAEAQTETLETEQPAEAVKETKKGGKKSPKRNG